MCGIFRRADNKTIAAHNLLSRGVPHDELEITVFCQILGIDIDFASRAAAGTPKRLLPQTSHLAHQRRTIGCCENIDFVGGLVRVTHLAVGRQFRFQRGPIDGSGEGFLS